MSPFLVFLNAARNLASMGMKREQVLDFAQREFGELTDLMKAQIDIEVVYGGASQLYTKEVLDYMIYVGNLDPAKVHKLDGAMHHLFLDMPEEFIELINKILKDD